MNDIPLKATRKQNVTLDVSVGVGAIELPVKKGSRMRFDSRNENSGTVLTVGCGARVTLRAPGTNIVLYSVFYSGEIYAGEDQ